MNRYFWRFGASLGLLASSAAASGNHHSAPMGGRSALMGGTGVALGVDGAAPFLNPATITRIAGGRLAFSARFYRYSQSRLTDFHQPGAADPDLFGAVRFGDTTETHQRVHSVPDSVCYFFPPVIGVPLSQRLSICLATSEEHELSLKALAYGGSAAGLRMDQNAHFDASWSRFNLGPTWGVTLGPDLALGASLMVTYTRYQHTILTSTVVENQADQSASTSSYQSVVSAFSWDFAPRIGATYRFADPLSAGLSLTIPVAHLLGGIRQTRLNEFDDTRSQWSGEGSFRAKPPLQVGLGLGAEWEFVRFEGDLFLTAASAEYAHGGVDRDELTVQDGAVTSRSRSSVPVRERSNTVLNLALGAEVFVARRLSLLAGAQTDVNALRELDPAAADVRLFRSRLDYYRAGFGLCSYTDFGDLLFGLRFDYGQGEALPVNALAVPSALGRSRVRELGFMLVLAGSLNWRSISQAAGDVGDIVRGTGGPLPSRPLKPLQEPKQD